MEAADWIIDALSDDLASVAWLVPRTFPAVARLLHPVVRGRFLGTLPPEEAPVLVDILRRFTTTASRCWFGVSREFGWNGSDYPLGGAPFEAESTALSPDADEGGTDIEVDRAPYDKPVVQAPHRSFMLYPGAIDDALLLAERFEWAQVPNLWWPEDRAWCVRTDIDLDSTYIGGSGRLVDALIADPRLEVLRATFDDEIARGV